MLVSRQPSPILPRAPGAMGEMMPGGWVQGRWAGFQRQPAGTDRTAKVRNPSVQQTHAAFDMRKTNRSWWGARGCVIWVERWRFKCAFGHPASA